MFSVKPPVSSDKSLIQIPIEPCPIYGLPTDSVSQLKHRIIARDGHILGVKFQSDIVLLHNDSLMQEFEDKLDDRCVMRENLIADFGLTEGDTFEVKLR